MVKKKKKLLFYRELQNKFNETQNNLKKVSNMLDKLQKTTVELSSVNSLVFKVKNEK
jgi:glutaredoxin 2